MWGAAKQIPALLVGSASSAWDLGSSAPSREVRDPCQPHLVSPSTWALSQLSVKIEVWPFVLQLNGSDPSGTEAGGLGWRGHRPGAGPAFWPGGPNSRSLELRKNPWILFPLPWLQPVLWYIPSYHLTGLRPQTSGAPHPGCPLFASERRSDDTSDPGPGYFLGKGTQRRSKVSRQRLRAEG